MGTANQYTIDPNSHPADRAMALEQSGSRSPVPLSGAELASMAQLSPAELVSHLANSDAQVPLDSPIRQMSSDELRTAMQQGMRAVNDFRKAGNQMTYAEQVAAAAAANPTNENVGSAIRNIQAAEKFNAASAHSAANVMTQGDYDAALQQLANDLNPSDPTRTMRQRFEAEQRSQDLQNIAATSPNAPDPQSNEATLNDLGSGQFALAYPTGEVFRGSMEEIQSAVIKAGIETKRWGRSLNAEVKQLRAQLAALQNGQAPGNPVPETPQPTWEQLGQLPDESSRFLVENAAKVLGYRNADELINHQLERDQKLASVEQKLEQYENDKILGDFMLMAPDYPDTKQAANAIAQIIDASGLEWNADNMALAHQHAVRKGLYQALRPEEIEVSNQPQPRSGRHVPPTPPTGNAPGAEGAINLWGMAQDELRKQVLEQGGLGRALMNLRPGERLGSE
jgi:hypothetical protein